MIAYSVKLAIECASRRARVCLHIHTSPGLLRRTAMPARHADREAARLIRHRHTAPDVGPSGSAINCNATPLVGLIVSATLERYQRAASVVARAGFQPALSPAVFVRPNETTCRGNEGHRQAMRVAWARVQASGERMCVFEDDIEDTQGPCAGARYISKAIGKDPTLDIVYISGHKNFYRNHAQSHARLTTPMGLQQDAGAAGDVSARRLPAAERGWRRRAATADARPRLLRAREAVQTPGGV